VGLAEAGHAALHAAYTRLAAGCPKYVPGLVGPTRLDDYQAKDLDAEAKINAAKAALQPLKSNLRLEC